MFGRDWSFGQATIVSRQESGIRRENMGAGPATYSYVADIQPEDGSAPFRASFDQRSQGLRYQYPEAGEQIRVKFDGKHHKVEIEQLARGGMFSAAAIGLDPELAELMRLEEAERAGGLPLARTDDRLNSLKVLAELRAGGVLNDAEFEAEKARILGGP
jgi:hypothetical protein